MRCPWRPGIHVRLATSRYAMHRPVGARRRLQMQGDEGFLEPVNNDLLHPPFSKRLAERGGGGGVGWSAAMPRRHVRTAGQLCFVCAYVPIVVAQSRHVQQQSAASGGAVVMDVLCRVVLQHLHPSHDLPPGRVAPRCSPLFPLRARGPHTICFEERGIHVCFVCV